MRFGIFAEMQVPRPWNAESDVQMFHQALEQVELVERLGFDYAWVVEHHFLEEYSHSSSPEVFLAAASQRTNKIRLGHGIVHMPSAVNHPVRVAERIAGLDLASRGRVEFGTGEGTGVIELDAFGVDSATKREQWRESVEAVVRLFTEEPFTGLAGNWVNIPKRNLVPKPLQKPHPPLWMASPRIESMRVAAQHGMGALCFSLTLEPEEVADWVAEYEAIIASDQCVPIGHKMNPELAFVVPMHCHADENVAVDRGLEGAQFFNFAIGRYAHGGHTHQPATSRLWEDYVADRAAKYDPSMVRRGEGAPLKATYDKNNPYALRGAIGTPEQIREKFRRYEAAGCDQLILLVQSGKTSHEQICQSLELFAREVLPEFKERDEDQCARKTERLSNIMSSAMDRRPAMAVASR